MHSAMLLQLSELSFARNQFGPINTLTSRRLALLRNDLDGELVKVTWKVWDLCQRSTSVATVNFLSSLHNMSLGCSEFFLFFF